MRRVEFGVFFDGRTPEDLKLGGLYHALALALYPDQFWPVSVALVAKAMGASGGRWMRNGFRTHGAQRSEPPGVEASGAPATDVTQPSNDDRATDVARSFFGRHAGNDAFVDASELRLMCGELGRELSEEDLSRVMGRLDTNGDGKIGFDEFLSWWNVGLAPPVAAALRPSEDIWCPGAVDRTNCSAPSDASVALWSRVAGPRAPHAACILTAGSRIAPHSACLAGWVSGRLHIDTLLDQSVAALTHTMRENVERAQAASFERHEL